MSENIQHFFSQQTIQILILSLLVIILMVRYYVQYVKRVALLPDDNEVSKKREANQFLRDVVFHAFVLIVTFSIITFNW